MKQMIVLVSLVCLTLFSAVVFGQQRVAKGHYGIRAIQNKVVAGDNLLLVLEISNESNDVWELESIQVEVVESGLGERVSRGDTSVSYNLRSIPAGTKQQFDLEVPIRDGKGTKADVTAYFLGKFGDGRLLRIRSSPKEIMIYMEGEQPSWLDNAWESFRNLFN